MPDTCISITDSQLETIAGGTALQRTEADCFPLLQRSGHAEHQASADVSHVLDAVLSKPGDSWEQLLLALRQSCCQG